MLQKCTMMMLFIVAQTIGNDSCKVEDEHSNIKPIIKTCTCNNQGSLSSKEINDDFVEKQNNKINVNKATGFDGVSVKILKTVETNNCKNLLQN